MDRHFLYDVLDLELFFSLKLTENINLFHDVHDNFSFSDIFLSYNGVKRLSIKYEAGCLCFHSDVSRSFCIVKHWNLSEHFTFHDCFDVNLLALRPSIAVKLSFINDINLISLISLTNDDCIFFVCFFSHCRDKFWCILVVEVLEEKKGLETEKNSVVNWGSFDNVGNLTVIQPVMRAINFTTNCLSLSIPPRFSFLVLNNLLIQEFFLTIAFTLRLNDFLSIDLGLYFLFEPPFTEIQLRYKKYVYDIAGFALDQVKHENFKHWVDLIVQVFFDLLLARLHL